MSAIEDQAKAVVDRFAAALDGKAFAEAIGLFTEDGSYRVMLRKNFERGGILGLINDDVRTLKLRCTMQHPAPLPDSVHLVSNVQATEDGKDRLSVRANFSVNRKGVPTFDGEYRITMRRGGETWRMSEVLVLLDGDSVPGYIVAPI